MRRTMLVVRWVGIFCLVCLPLGGCGGTESQPADGASGKDGQTALDGRVDAGSPDAATADSVVILPDGAGSVHDSATDTRVDVPQNVDVAQNMDTASSSDSAADLGKPDMAIDGKVCGPNPAEACPATPGQCIPSTCYCSDGVWGCTADCRTKYNCVDAGTGKTDGAAPGLPCGKALCAGGDYCCNVNCGTCAPVGAMCAQIACDPPSTWACTRDADCHLVDDYCTGCDCRALGPSGSLATCAGPGVQCIAEPCAVKVARCSAGVCVAANATN